MDTGQVKDQQGAAQLGGGNPASRHSAREHGGNQIGQGGAGRQSYMPPYDMTALTGTTGPVDGDGEFMEGWPSLTRELPGHDAHEELYDPEYQQWRAEQLRRFDEDYRRWRQERFSRFLEEFKQWRQRRSGSADPSTPKI